MNEIKMILESGENLASLLENGGAYLFAYLAIDSLLEYAIGAAALYAAYLLAKKAIGLGSQERALREIRDALKVGSRGVYTDSEHDQVMAKIKDLTL